ncbi:hypothetical protein KM043_001729 [Ampulex compressa]|nr:hypothetical protein KM043_001729 [Ampulex compressa]
MGGRKEKERASVAPELRINTIDTGQFGRGCNKGIPPASSGSRGSFARCRFGAQEVAREGRCSRLFDLARVLRKLAPSVLGTPQRKTDGEDRGKAILCVLCRTVNKSQAKRDRDTLALKARKIATFSEVCKGEITSRSESAEKERKTLTDMTCCQGLQSYTSAAMTDSGKTAWAEQTESSCRKGSKVACGMLPTLRALASKGGDSRDTTCLVPFDAEMDSASHLQMILLEAYCRETGVKVLRVSRERLRNHLCPGSGDLSCVLIANDDPFFLETPE